MGSDVGPIFPTASLHRDHSISYALVCEKRFSTPGKKSQISLSGVQEKIFYTRVKSQISLSSVSTVFLDKINLQIKKYNV